MKNGIGLQLGCAMAAEGLLNGSWSALGGFQSRKKLAWRPLGAVLERLRSLQDGPTGSEGRSTGGQGEVEGRLTEHVWLAMAPGERHLSEIID